jgi:hypothetical protein
MRTEVKTVTVICDECGANMTGQDLSPVVKTVTYNGKDYLCTHVKAVKPVARADDPTYDICKDCRSAVWALF